MSSASDKAEQALASGNVDGAIRLLEDGCAADDADSLFVLATWYLAGQGVGRDLAEAAALLAAARSLGQIDAALMEVALVGNGAFAPPDWPRAFALLSALPGSDPRVAAQRALLGRMKIEPDGRPSTVPAPEQVGSSPDVYMFRALMTPDECRHLMNAALPLMEPSVVVDPATGRHMANPIRTSDGAVIGPAREDLVIQAMTRRLAACSGTDAIQGEPLSVLRYAPGQQYRLHMDSLPATPNQRIMTMIIYLNDGYAGGETAFEANGIQLAGRVGDVALFSNVLPDGRPDPASRHAGQPVVRGEKWIATRWIRANPYNPWTWRPGE